MVELPKISIVTPSFNSVSTIGETINSVREQDYKNWEHIVMDGGSRDGTLALLEKYRHLTVVSEKDQGHFHAMNKGIARAAGEVVVILNADDCFRVGALRHAVEGFQNHPSWDALFGDVVFVDGRGRKIYQREEAVYDFKVLLFAVDYICHQALFVRKAVYDRLGGYRHEEFLKAADYEFKLRLGREGCRVGHVPHLLVNFRYHLEGRSSDLQFVRQSTQEAERIRREYGNPGGWRGKSLRILFKGKRQLQKLLLRHKFDLLPGTWRLRAHLRQKTET